MQKKDSHFERSISVYWSATDFTGNDTTWYFTDDPGNLSGKELTANGSLLEEKNYIREYRLLQKYQRGQFLVIAKAVDTGYLKMNEIIMTFAEIREYILHIIDSGSRVGTSSDV